MTYDTMNPVPSIDPRDLDDNAQAFDRFLQSTAASEPDRLGVQRKTWHQMELDAAVLTNANVAALAGLTGAADRLPYFTGAGALALAVLTSVARTFLAAATQAAQRTALGLGSAALLPAGTANGAATLDANGLLPVSQLPPLAVNSTFTVASQAAMLALTAERGDVAIRTDLAGAAYILTADAPATLANWVAIQQNLGVALTALGALTPAADTLPYFSGTATAAATAFTAQARTFMAAATLAAQRTALGLGSAAVAPIVGTVSQASGVPTGAIIETGGTLTGTGKYTKYADGTMTVIKFLTTANGSVTAAGSIFRSTATAGGAFPVPWVGDTPTVQCSGTDSAGGGWVAMDTFPTLTSWGSYSTRNHVSSGTSGTILLKADGRWF